MGLSLGSSGLSHEFTSHGTAAVRTAKAWDRRYQDNNASRQNCITATFKQRNGHTLHVRKATADGLIVDWDFIKEQLPGDSKQVTDSLMSLTQHYGQPKSYSADRGFDAENNRGHLKKQTIFNAICPRSVPSLKQRLEDDEFCRLQKRRAATEARIGIFKNAYLGTPLRSKGFENRKTRIQWCILAHNLWKLARMTVQNLKWEAEKQAA